jgi:hypothetical protein
MVDSVGQEISIPTNRPTTTDQRSEPQDRNALRHACGAAVVLKEHEMELEAN